MNKQVSARLRAPLTVIAAGAVVAGTTIAVRGWAAVPVLILASAVLLMSIGYYVWSGRDGDMAASIRHRMDERQAYRRLRVQALVGRVMTLAATVSYFVAVDDRATLWPFAVALGLPVLTFATGWLLYGDRAADAAPH